MKKRIASTLLCAAMAGAVMAGCGNHTSVSEQIQDGVEREEDTAEADGENGSEDKEAEGEGKVLNIYCWNNEFQSRMERHYPGYVKTDDTTGMIGDITVKWDITQNEGNLYQNHLDAALLRQADAKPDDKIDLFLVEADNAVKYVDSKSTMALTELGITGEDLSEQYQYTKDIATDSYGVLKGVSWQGCPGVFFYNREAAKEVLGSDDPAEVQKAVSDWETFKTTAETLKEAGYSIVSSVNDTYRVYSTNAASKWVDNGKIQIDENIMKWVNDSKELVDAGETGTHPLWSDEWKQGFYPEGKVFGYFGPAWLVNFSMEADKAGSIGNAGGWGATEGPQGFFWGGTWICAAAGTDNADLVKDIILQMTTNQDVMKGIAEEADDFVNNKTVMEAMAKDTGYSSKVLGGQNPIFIYCAGVDALDLSNLSEYDQGCNEEFQSAMKDYFEGKVSLEEALERFYTAVESKYPRLSH